MTDTAPAIDALLAEHADLERQLSDPALHSDAAKARKVGRRFAALAPIVATYRKLFPWLPLETSVPGDAFTVFDIPGAGRFGLMICYDGWYPVPYDPLVDKHIIERRRARVESLGEALVKEEQQPMLL